MTFHAKNQTSSVISLVDRHVRLEEAFSSSIPKISVHIGVITTVNSSSHPMGNSREWQLGSENYYKIMVEAKGR